MSWLGEAVVAWIKPKIEKEMKEENKKRGIKDRELVDETGGKK